MTAEFELFCDDPRHKTNRDGSRRTFIVAKFRKASPMPPGGFRQRAPGEKVERLPEVWSVDPGASAERRKKQRAWTPPPAEPVQQGDDPTRHKISFDQVMARVARVQPPDDNKLGVYLMAGRERINPIRPRSAPGAPVREKFERKCSLCPRRVDRYMDDLGQLFDLLLIQDEFRLNLECLAVMLAEQAKRKR